VKKRDRVDEARVYAVGVSNGAFMAHRWACSSTDLAGIAAISGVGPGSDDPPCKPEREVFVLQIHGDRDEVIHYGGGQGSNGRYPSVLESTKRWADLNGCREHRGPETSFSFYHGTTKREEWLSAKPCVVLWTFEDGGHQLKSVRFASSEIIATLAGER
jgi:polyhydroxybutyrate depolymerase